LCRYCAP
jgi:hypothetical protein